ncbi:hypothetical protein [Calothrix sp. PCC 7507]|uniref:hypothetical protein n=1 Tax=Calothrix sp. PCC 7507 TaxID=99598 RepID=UPI00029F2C90|nr:hypothetical protein [Calothrix sp. PCC 7507]AFY30920.1 hypothetical protein Cal7507_0425 [Calothrix sp. PCC 7507]
MGRSELGDSRRTERAIAANPQGSIPERTISRHHPEVLAREFIPELMLKVLVAKLVVCQFCFEGFLVVRAEKPA